MPDSYRGRIVTAIVDAEAHASGAFTPGDEVPEDARTRRVERRLHRQIARPLGLADREHRQQVLLLELRPSPGVTNQNRLRNCSSPGPLWRTALGPLSPPPPER
jgi:hypothetical protein